MLEVKDFIFPLIFMMFYSVIYLISHKRKGKNILAKQFIVKLIFVGYISTLFSLLLLYNTHIVLVESQNNPFLTFGFYGNNYVRLINIVPFKTIFEQLHSGSSGYINIIFNSLLLLPLPIFLKIIKPKLNYAKCMAIAASLTICVETIQYFIGRSCDIDDIILNLIGASIGILIFKFTLPQKAKSLFE